MSTIPCISLWQSWASALFGKLANGEALKPHETRGWAMPESFVGIEVAIQAAKREGLAGLCMLNLFAFAATDPKAMKSAIEPIGESNDAHIVRCLVNPRYVVCAWGTHGSYSNRDRSMKTLLNSVGPEMYQRVVCLGMTKDGHPKHPLYIRADQPFVPFSL